MKNEKITKKHIKELLAIAAKVKSNAPVTPEEVDRINNFQLNDQETKFHKALTTIALPGSIVLGMSMVAFPAFYSNLAAHLPSWTNMNENFSASVDYVWSIIGEPVEKQNVIYHVPNIILYSFGIAGIKKIFEYLRKKSWLDKVDAAKSILKDKMSEGKVNYNLTDGHSLLFVGDGDFIGQQFYMECDPDEAIILSSKPQNFTAHWLKYDPDVSFNSLQDTLDLADAYNCGEYLLFPIKDTEMFLPGPGQCDLSPEKIEVMIQAIRDIERLKGWSPKRIILVGDKKQTSCIQTESFSGVISGTTENVSLESISKRFEKIVVIDPSDLVIKLILERFPGRKILFRSSIDGGAEYKARFYERLKEFGYTDNPENDYSLVVGYDLYEEQIERESIATRLQEYMPVVLSREVYDALLRNDYASEDFIYVPAIVLDHLKASTNET